MDYKETCDFLFNRLAAFHRVGASAYKPGMDTAYTLSEAFSNPHDAFMSVHIAGTNGKGSTSHSLASVLHEAGYKVGLYTSPHIFDFRERIRVDGEPITENGVVDFTERFLEMNPGCSPSFFELATIMAFDWFRKCGVDIAVVETGLGGRLDTTNIITPLLSVITNVSLDHTDLLGNTVELIAAEKAGIIKPGVPAVVGSALPEVRAVFEAKARRCGASITFVQDLGWNPSSDGDGGWIFPFRPGGRPEIKCDLKGEFQKENIATVLTVLDQLQRVLPADMPVITYKAIADGIGNVYGNTGLMGRWTVIRDASPRIICDTGHNIGAWEHLAPMLREIARSSELRIVLGFVSDKDIEPIFDILPENARYYYVSPASKRGRSATDLAELGREHGLVGKAYDAVMDGVNSAVSDSAGKGTVFIGGSNFVVSEIRTV